MELIEAKCPKCGARVDVDGTEKTAKCKYCEAIFVVSNAQKLGKVGDEKTKEIKNLRQLLQMAIDSNDIKNISDYASKICEIIPDDYSARYYFAYAQNAIGKNTYLSDFYADGKGEYTDNELNEIIEHIYVYSDLRDKGKIIKYFSSVLDGDNAEEVFDRYKRHFQSRKKVEENYDIVPRDVFLCHRSSDIKIVETVREALEKDGHTCWISTRNLRPNDSENYWDNIEKAIKSCSVFLVVSSDASMLSPDVKKELNIAGGLKKPRVEYKIDDSPHTTLFKSFFDGSKWIEGQGDVMSLNSLCGRVFDEIEAIKNAGKKTSDLDKIKELFEKGGSTVNNGSGVSLAALVKKAWVLLGDKNFDEVEKTCEKISDIDIENPDLWLLKFLAEEELTSIEDIEGTEKDFTQNASYIKALKRATPENREKLEGFVLKEVEEIKNKARIKAEEARINAKLKAEEAERRLQKELQEAKIKAAKKEFGIMSVETEKAKSQYLSKKTEEREMRLDSQKEFEGTLARGRQGISECLKDLAWRGGWWKTIIIMVALASIICIAGLVVSLVMPEGITLFEGDSNGFLIPSIIFSAIFMFLIIGYFWFVRNSDSVTLKIVWWALIIVALAITIFLLVMSETVGTLDSITVLGGAQNGFIISTTISLTLLILLIPDYSKLISSIKYNKELKTVIPGKLEEVKRKINELEEDEKSYLLDLEIIKYKQLLEYCIQHDITDSDKEILEWTTYLKEGAKLMGSEGQK